MAYYKPLNAEDILQSSKIKTYGAWSDSPLDANKLPESIISTFYTASTEVTGWDGNYFYNVYAQDVNTYPDGMPQFSVAFATSGAIELSTTDAQLKYTYPSYAVYRQFVNYLTNGNSDTNLQYTSNGTIYNIATAYIISINRDRFRDGLDTSTWQLNLVGTNNVTRSFVNAAGNGAADQQYYEIVSGSYSDVPGVGITYADNQVISYGRFYPAQGTFVLDANQISSSIGTIYSVNASTVSPYNPDFGLMSIYQAFKGPLVGSSAGSFKLRAKEKVQSSFYFIRAKNSEFNGTENPTWVSGSNNEVISDFYVEPKVYITTIGLYGADANGHPTPEPLAVAKLSSPLLKTVETELSCRVKLDW